jgi:outer membrane immunogenic protein
MKKLSIAGMAAIGALLAGPAMAADMALPNVYKGPPPIVPAFNWTGCYLGGQVGGGFMKDSEVDNQSDPIFHGGGAIAGGQVGCNYQVQQFVLGIEGEGWWSGLKNKSTDNFTNTFTNALFPGQVETDTFTNELLTKNRWDAAISFRGGYAVDRILFYGKAGVVWGGFSFTGNNSEVDVLNGTTTFLNQSSFQESKTLTGMLLGFGIEYALTPNWLFRAEADYLNFPRTDVPFTAQGTCCGVPPDATVRTTNGVFSEFASKGLLKIGLSYKFY